MKNTDPPDSTRHKPKRAARRPLRLTPELQRFIQHMGSYFENSGVPRIGGMILGLLILAHEPLSAEQIGSILKISRGSITTNFRILATVGLAERFTSHADRTTYYIFPDTAWEQLMALTIRRVEVFRGIVDEGLHALTPQDAAHARLVMAQQYSDIQIKGIQKAIEEWRALHKPGPAKRLFS